VLGGGVWTTSCDSAISLYLGRVPKVDNLEDAYIHHADSIMARTDEAEAFFHAVYSAIQEIPHGKVTSYGHIARLIGTRKLRMSPLNLERLPVLGAPPSSNVIL
jgi:hypothetical protein